MLYDVTARTSPTWTSWEAIDLGIYRKIRVRVATLDGRRHGLDLRAQRLRGRPAARALPRRLADAAESAGAPADYVDRSARAPVPLERGQLSDRRRRAPSDGTVCAS